MDTRQLFDAAKARYPELTGKVAIVTGSSRGIGKGIAIRLAKEGMKVVINGVTPERVQTVTEEVKACGADAVGIIADVGATEGADKLIDGAMQAFGRLDLLVNNAATLKRYTFFDVTETILDENLAANLRGPYLCIQKAAVIMRQQGAGSIVNISSVGGLRAHHRGLPYDMTKGGLDMMTRAFAIDLIQYGIRVNSIAPGAIRTEKTLPEDHPDIMAAAARIPEARFGHVLEVGASVAFLASEESGYMVGQVIYVDGGLTVQLTPPGQPV
jgi:NAD(P)-dependent dehydrogenase (short-subunit alcohol dehydrogenase family)